MKMAAVFFISKAFLEFGCLFFENSNFFNLSELLQFSLFFQRVNLISILLGCEIINKGYISFCRQQFIVFNLK